MSHSSQLLRWSGRFRTQSPSKLQPSGDKIILPQSALESLLAAAPSVNVDEFAENTSRSTFDPYNPYSVAAARQIQAQYRSEQPQLPYPLTFRLLNSKNGRVVYAGVKEFSAQEGEIGLSDFLTEALASDQVEVHSNEDSTLKDQTNSYAENMDGSEIVVDAAQIPKGKFVKLRPLEAGYDPDDWKSLLEEHLRKNYTTLTRGEVLSIPTGRDFVNTSSLFRFMIDSFEPQGDAICIVDTDLEVDIEALNEEQARETLMRVAAKRRTASAAASNNSSGGTLTYLQRQSGCVIPGEYVDYELSSWDRSRALEIELSSNSGDSEIEIFSSPFSDHQRSRPRLDEHIFANVQDGARKRIKIEPSNIEMENVEQIWISVHAPRNSIRRSMGSKDPLKYCIQARPFSEEETESYTSSSEPDGDKTRCKNCLQIVPKQSSVLHESFCYRNNILCTKGCGKIFKKASLDLQNHWHCETDDAIGDSSSSWERHNAIAHTEKPCPSCEQSFPNILRLARHRTSDCPGKLILCKFCHLIVPQEGNSSGIPDPEVIVSGLTPHELADGARTTDCHICQRIVRLRDLETHMKHHDLERLRRVSPKVCRNVNCGRTVEGVSKNVDTKVSLRMDHGAGNDIGLCSICFGPLYVSMYDPEGKALKRRVERKYLSQLLSGCDKQWCRNQFCKSGLKHRNMELPNNAKESAMLAKPYVDGLTGADSALHFCVDEASQRRRELAELLAADYLRTTVLKSYSFEWCLGALEAENGNLEKAREWLKYFAPAIGE